MATIHHGFPGVHCRQSHRDERWKEQNPIEVARFAFDIDESHENQKVTVLTKEDISEYPKNSILAFAPYGGPDPEN